jgi:hypothetical protein
MHKNWTKCYICLQGYLSRSMAIIMVNKTDVCIYILYLYIRDEYTHIYVRDIYL